MTDFVLDDFLPYQFAVLATRISRSFSEVYKERFGLTIPEWRILANLAELNQASVREIFERADMDKPKISRAAARLEEAGYITKIQDPSDKRLVILSLTPSGRDLVAQILPRALEFQASVLAQLGPDGPAFQRTMARLMKDLA